MRIGTFIIDDQADMRLLLRMVIDAANDGLFVSGEAPGGHEAIDQLHDLDPTVVILDQMMPGLSGVETAALILRDRPGQRIILLTAHLDDDVRAKAEEAGIQVCVAKGRPTDLVGAIRALAEAC